MNKNTMDIKYFAISSVYQLLHR